MSKRQIVLSETLAKARYLVRATLGNETGSSVKGVLCGVFLPERLADPIKLHFQPTRKQVIGVNFARFSSHSTSLSFKATMRYGGRRITFSASKIWCSNTSEGHHDGIHFVTDFTAEPADFRILKFGLTKGSPPGGTFSLTPNALINTAMTVMRSYTGSVKVRRICRPRFTLRSGIRLAFTEHFRYRDSHEGETISSAELVAEFTPTRKFSGIDACREDLDNLLLLTSFAARHRCVCMDWSYSNRRGDIVEHYRRDIVTPKERKISRDDALVSMAEFPRFIRVAYRNFSKFKEKDQFRSALYPLINDAEKTTEMSYFSLFSALESALLFADRTFNLFRKKGHQSLHERWRLFQTKYAVDASDLWPIIDDTGGVTLTQLRNKVAHGEYLDPAQTLALLYAREHLRWTVERVLLSLLGWPISSSKVSSSSLGRLYPYLDWSQARTAF